MTPDVILRSIIGVAAMTPDVILRSIIDCEACGHDWPRLCAWHAAGVELYADQLDREGSHA